MKIIQFYPEIIEKDSFVSRLTFEPGGIFIRKDSKVYYNDEILTLTVSASYELARPSESFRFTLAGDASQSISIKANDINKKTNLRELITKFISAQKKKMKKSEKEQLFADLELANIDALIDYSLQIRDEEMFNKIITYREEMAPI